MKTRLKYILSGFFIILFATSCEKWLDVTATSEIKAEDQFMIEDGYKDALMGVYIGMTSPSLYSRDMNYNIVDLLSQQYATLDNLAVYSDIQRYQYETTKGSSQIDRIWRKMYNTIANINSELGHLNKNEDLLDPINFSIIKGELLGLRAFLHFDLMRLYGYGNVANRSDISGKFAIPYVLDYTKDVTPQLSYAQTFTLLNADIDEALELLKEDPIYFAVRDANYYETVNNDGFYDNRENRMNYYAVMALKARTLLWQGGTENIDAAGIAAEDVILNSFSHLIDPETYPVSSDPILYPEHLFNLNITAFADIVDYYLNANQSTNYQALYLPTSVAEDLYETTNTNIGPVDLRFNTLLENQTLGKLCIKLRQDQGIYNPNITPLIKLSEMYYIAAESSITGSAVDLNKAIDYLNVVRSSRGIIDEILPASDLATVNEELFKEYRKEFINEGQLFFYYKRNGFTTFPGISIDVVVDDVIYLLPYPDSELEFGRIQ